MDFLHQQSTQLTNNVSAGAVAYEPYWTAHSIYTPLRNPSQEPDPAKCSESMLVYLTAKLGREVVGVEPKILGHGVFHVVRHGRSCCCRPLLCLI